MLLAFPAKWIWGEGMLLQSAAAMALCLIPGLGIMTMAGRLTSGPPDWRIGLFLIGAIGRMAICLGLGAILFKKVPGLDDNGFWIWLLVFYLLTLAVEVGLILQSVQAALLTDEAAKDRHGA
jgi:hypothetical protein